MEIIIIRQEGQGHNDLGLQTRGPAVEFSFQSQQKTQTGGYGQAKNNGFQRHQAVPFPGPAIYKPSSASACKSSFCLSVKLSGDFTKTWTIRSPRPDPVFFGAPWPLIRNFPWF